MDFFQCSLEGLVQLLYEGNQMRFPKGGVLVDLDRTVIKIDLLSKI